MHTSTRISRLFLLCFLTPLMVHGGVLVFQSDFGRGEGGVSAMHGVAVGIDEDLKIYDLSHEIPQFDIWAGAYVLYQTAPYWPEGTVFVSVVDPGVGTERKSVVMKTQTGHFFVTPDNGTLTMVALAMGVEEVREIDEAVNRRKDSGKSYTFHGRDVYAYTGARLASGAIDFEEVGPSQGKQYLAMPVTQPIYRRGKLHGMVDILDFRYGNIWTNIDSDTFAKSGIEFGDTVVVTIRENKKIIYQDSMPYAESFGMVEEGEPLMYLNSLLKVAFALNMGDFAAAHGIQYGPDWTVEIEVE